MDLFENILSYSILRLKNVSPEKLLLLNDDDSFKL